MSNTPVHWQRLMTVKPEDVAAALQQAFQYFTEQADCRENIEYAAQENTADEVDYATYYGTIRTRLTNPAELLFTVGGDTYTVTVRKQRK